MALFTVLCCIIALILLVSWAKVNPFLAFLVVSIATGLLLGIPVAKVNASIQKGLGDTLGSLCAIICLGAMLGKLVAVSGAAQTISESFVKLVGQKHIQLGLVAAGFIIGIPLFYGIGFVLMVPLIFSITYKYKLPAVYIGLPMLASLSVTHGFLPPHPSPSALVILFKASMAKTLVYGLIIGIPTVLIAGPLFTRLMLRNIRSEPLDIFRAADLPGNQRPGAFVSFLTALLPVILLLFTSLVGIKPGNSTNGWLAFMADPGIVMLIALLFATYTLGIKQGKSMMQLGAIYTDAIKDIAIVLLIIGASGAFKQILIDSGVSTQLTTTLGGLPLPPLVLGWLIAAAIRVCLGSATVAGLTAAGIVSGMVTQGNVSPELMVLAIGAGSLACSHVNDSGFWLYKEYFNLSIKDTVRSWSMMETLVAVFGLIGVLLLNLFI